MSKYKYQDPFTLSDAVEVAPEAEFDERPDVEQQNDDQVPDGTTKEILDWVDGDTDRAQRALNKEESKGEDGLKGLKRELKKLLES